MANEIGLELEEQNAPAQDRSMGAFQKFFKDPKNIATALIFGASLAQPREQGRDGLATMMQRAAGAAAFRGALDSGVQQKKLQREQTAFERAQEEKQAQQRDEQLSMQREGLGLQATQLAMDQSQFERQLMANETQAQLDRELEAALASGKNGVSDADLIKIAADMVPNLLETMQFDEGMSSEQRILAAQDQALKGLLLFRSVLSSGGQIIRGGDGRLYVDDGTGTPAPVPQPGPAPAPAPAAAATPAPKPSARERRAAFEEKERQRVVAPTLGERISTALQRNALATEQRGEELKAVTRKNMIRNGALQVKRAFEIGALPNRHWIGILQDATDDELREVGMSDQMILGVRRTAEQM